LKQGDVVWGSIFMSALFIGLISAFLGMGVGGGLLSILTLLSSAIIMVGLGILIKKRNLKWLETYAIPISMLGAMGLSLLFSIVL
jgi:predicted permease